MFVYTVTVDGKYPLEMSENLVLSIQMHLQKKWKTFSQLFVTFSEYTLSLKLFEKNVIVITNAFPKLKTAKDLDSQ